MAKEKRLTKMEELPESFDFEGRNLEDVLEDLHDIQAEYSDKYHELRFDVDYAYNREYENDRLILVGHRLENDKEYEARMAQERAIRENKKKAKAKKEAEERALFEKLKAKYEGK